MKTKLAYVKRPPTQKELRESREFYEALGPLTRKRRKREAQR